ncbi:MAG: DUF3185 family protein [Phycisphaerales bacterium]|nr:DUF3185 family protein [Phycisphaerales bacterium]
MQKVIGLVLIAVGVVLLVLGISAADSLSSDISRFFTGEPTDRAIWLLIGGVAAIVGGGVLAALPGRALKT